MNKPKKRKSAAKMIADAKKQMEKDKQFHAKAIAKFSKPQKPAVSKDEAQSRTAYICSVFKTMGKMWWELGVEVKRAIDDGVPEALGKNAHEWMTQCFGDSWLKIYRAHRAVEALAGVEMEKLEKISEGNAYALARLPEKVRKSSDWIERASKLPNEEFKEAADAYIAKKTGFKDPMLKVTDVLGFVTLPKSLYDIMKVTMKVAAEVLGADLDTKQGKVDIVEAIFAEYQLAHLDKQPEVA